MNPFAEKFTNSQLEKWKPNAIYRVINKVLFNASSKNVISKEKNKPTGEVIEQNTIKDYKM